MFVVIPLDISWTLTRRNQLLCKVMKVVGMSEILHIIVRLREAFKKNRKFHDIVQKGG